MAKVSDYIAKSEQMLGSGATVGTARRGVIPASVKGMNSRDSLVTMKEEYALNLINFFPEQGSVQLRKGYVRSVTGASTSAVNTLFTYISGTNAKLYAVAGSSIYDVTPAFHPGGAINPNSSPTEVVSAGITNSRWNTVLFNQNAIMVNGVDAPLRIDNMGDFVAHGFSGPTDLSDLIGVTAFKHRLFFWEKDSPNIWYGGTDAVTGALSRIDTSLVTNAGGNVTAIGSSNMDSGTGIDDRLAIFLSTGHVILYEGTDPAVAANWREIGQYNIGHVIGNDALVQLGGDLIAICDNGFTSVRNLITPLAQSPFLRLSDPIQSLVTDDIRTYGHIPGWHATLYPRSNWLLFNVPEIEGGRAHQYVQNSQTGAWCRFNDMPITSSAVFGGRLYFGTAGGIVYLADEGFADDNATIRGEMLTAFARFKSSEEKQIRGVRAHLSGTPGIQVDGRVLIDYQQDILGIAPTNIAIPGSGWGVPWGSAWEAETTHNAEWRDARESGVAMAFGLRSATQGNTIAFHSADVSYETHRSLL